MINYYLGKCYAADVLGKGNIDACIQDFKKRLSANQYLKKQAQIMVNNLPQEVIDRCFVSKKNHKFLTLALKE